MFGELSLKAYNNSIPHALFKLLKCREIFTNMYTRNVVVVVTRWYGGVKLGADRFRCINAVARETLVKGGFVAGEKETEKDSKGKGKKGKK